MIAAIIIFFLCFIASQTLLVFMPYATTAAMPLSSETDKLALLLIPITEQEGRRVTRQQNMEDTIRECLVSFTRIGIACSEKVPSQRMGIKDYDKNLNIQI
ncbi:hypothetical protein Ahy_A07g031955 [Arachis hypogaea]|uniref:Uncharacterized protein n=1 Tax=Arachis hypogaea TaxID=3818 RepID=A0A445C5G6_ARAHY|nr:hypothetical protein Ahy_A07g031955 [Arachis hypogaea]